MKKTLLFKSIALSLFMLFSIGVLNAQVFITELADPNNASGARYVELYNSGSSDIDLSTGWQLQRATNGNDYWQDPKDLTGTILAGGFYIVCANQATFTTTYGFAADQDFGTGGAADSNGDDQLKLLSPGSVVEDMFGVLAEDGSNTNHEFEDGRAERKASVTAGNATYTFSEWNIWNDTGAAETTQLPQDAPDAFDPGAWIGHSDALVATDLFFSECVEGKINGNNRVIEIFNGTGAEVDLSTYTVKQSHGGTGFGTEGIMYVLPLTGMLADGDVFVIANESADASVLAAADLTFAYGDDQGHKIPFFTGDDALALYKSDAMIDVIGIELVADGAGPWAVAGIAGATQDHTLIRKNTITQGNTDWTASAGTDATDSEWVVYDNATADYIENIGTHTFGEEPPPTGFDVTFNVDMNGVTGFVPGTDLVYLSGDIAGWAEPGSNAANEMTDGDSDGIYTLTLTKDPAGDIVYKYFINPGWNTWGEWVGDPNRSATISEATTLNDVFGYYINDVAIATAPFFAGDDITITWTSAGGVDNVKIEAYIPGETGWEWNEIVASTPSTGTFPFIIPTDAWHSTDYLARVSYVTNNAVNDVSEKFEIIATPSIFDIQSMTSDGDLSEYDGQKVRISGVVTAIAGSNFWIQMAPVGKLSVYPEWSAIFGYDATVAGAVVIGDDVTLEATIDEYYNATEIVSVTSHTVNSQGNVISPVAVTAAAALEAYESTLITIMGAEVKTDPDGNGEFTVNDGTADYIVDDKMFAYTPTIGEFIDVTGVTTYSYGAFKIYPRSTDDVVVAGGVGIDDLFGTDIRIYPNPSHGKFYVQMDDVFNMNTKIEVFNVIGMKVFETIATNFKTEIDLSSMKQGVYYVRVEDGQNVLTQKIMKQ